MAAKNAVVYSDSDVSDMASPARANVSDVWKYVEKVGDKSAKCKFCQKVLAYHGGTTNLMQHVRQLHPLEIDVAQKNSPKQQTLGSWARDARPVPESKKNKINELLAQFIAGAMLPVSVVQSPELIALLGYLEPSYKVPCRQTMTGILDAMALRRKDEIKNQLSKADGIVGTTDVWSSITNDSYLSLTVSYVTDEWQMATAVLSNVLLTERHTAAVLATEIGTEAKEWGIASKMHAIVHDGASNMTKIGAENGWTDIYCAAHRLHLVVTDALNGNGMMSKTLAAASKLVGHFNHSPMATNELKKQQLSMGIEKAPLAVIQHVSTRWNSIYSMFKRLTVLRYVHFLTFIFLYLFLYNIRH